MDTLEKLCYIEQLKGRINELELRLDAYNGNLYDVVCADNDKLREKIAVLEDERNAMAEENRILSMRVQRLVDASPRWISVGERLPELCQVVFFGGNNFVDVGHYTNELPQWTSVLNSGGFWYGKKCKLVTHWMPLPSAPESEDE